MRNALRATLGETNRLVLSGNDASLVNGRATRGMNAANNFPLRRSGA
jgi:hypothetical protein